MTPTDILNPIHYQEVRQPLLQASNLPSWCYTSQVFYQREVDKIFNHGWHFVGREDELPNPGDFLTYDGIGGPAMIIRNETGQINAFFNTCRHRGMRLLEGSGSIKHIVCPYHSWVYSCEGTLVRTPGMKGVHNFEKESYGLLPLKLDNWGGFLFIRYSDDGPELKDWLGDMPDFFRNYSPQLLRCVRRKSFDVQCNWKLLIENALETYHTGTVHQSTLGRQQSHPKATAGEWSCLFVYVDGKKTLSILPNSTQTLPINPDLSKEQQRGTFFTNIYPCTQFVFAPDSMWWLAIQPQSPTRSRLEVGSCFTESTIATPDFQQTVQSYFERWDTATAEDNAICEAQQIGQSVQARPPGRFAEEEHLVHELAIWTLDRILD
ncbi:MAG: aromatic ring-hydroxylating dioxygenase subunit alpha [Acidiferrobacteraceae bacterium]|nr:aromatic ring-hydroxylating dioxygenase subunit alpha [Acidiferrobacteraceae bacterium]